jgi:YesN/AraC family two-component response regulator
VLTRAGFRVTVASAAEGIAAFEREPPDIVITDIIMPKIHGIDVIKSIPYCPRTRTTSLEMSKRAAR